MAWGTGARDRTNTREWHRARARILKRDNRLCYVCKQFGADSVDHIKPVAEGGTDDDSNLASIHKWPCHARKSSAEGGRGRSRKYSTKRPREAHPGLR